MVFSSLIFIFVFLPVSLIVYYLVPNRYKNACLMLFSLLFYAWGEPVYIFLMVFAILFNFIAGKIIEAGKTNSSKKAVLILSICVNLSLIIFFKYSALFLKTFHSLSGIYVPDFSVSLPIGISFYTFESISYVVDIYRGDAPAQENIIDFAAYLSLFPHLIAGPIIRYRDLAGQLKSRNYCFENFSSGCRRFCVGLSKKVLVADQLSQLVNKVQFYGSNSSVLCAWLGALAFTFQIYFDFSGYSDMAIGLGKMFGFELPENFNYPYKSKSAAEFWRRWHMTLGGWFREYLYIPLGGNRCSVLNNVKNLAIVWVLTGLWHGASWNFAFWGAYWGLLIICEKLFLNKVLAKMPSFFRWLYAFLAAVIGWVFFNNTDLSKAFGIIRAMFGFTNGIDQLGVYSLLTYGIILSIAAIGCSQIPTVISRKLLNSGKAGKIIWCAGFTGLFIISISFLVGDSYSPFLYFRF